MDRSQKLPQRLAGTVRTLARAAFPCLAVEVAAWVQSIGGINEQGQR